MMRFLKDSFIPPPWILFFTLAFNIAYFFFAHEGFYFNDDFGNARLAAAAMHGNFQFADLPAYHRFLIFWPAAFLIKILGVNIYSLTLWPLLCTVGSLLITYLLFRQRDKILCGFALTLVGLQFHTLFLSNYFFPDNIVQFFTLAAAGCLFAARRSGHHPFLYGFFFLLCCFCAFLSKETIFFYVPFFILVAVHDFYKGNNRVFWKASVVSGLVLGGIYLLFYKLTFGSFFYRFTMLENTHLLMAENESYRNIDPVSRLVKAPVPFFIETGIFLPVALCIYFFRNTKIRHLFNPDSGQHFWMLLGFSALLFFWFGTTSLQSYRPITLVPRMAAPVIPPLCIAAAYQLRNYFSCYRGSLWFALPLLLAALYARSAMSAVYVLPGIIFLYFWWKNNSNLLKYGPVLLLLTLTVALLLRPLHFMLKPTVSSFFEQEEILKKLTRNQDKKVIIFADGWLEKSQAYYFGFKPQTNVLIYNYDNWQQAENPAGARAYLLINESTLNNPDLQFKTPQPGFTITLPEIHKRFPAKKLIQRKGKVQLYVLLSQAGVTKNKAQ